MNPRTEEVALKFHSCKSGWIELSIGLGVASQRFSVSYVRDSFSEMIEWLEMVVRGDERAEFKFDLEGAFAVIESIRNADDTQQIAVYTEDHREKDRHLLFKGECDRRQMISEVYSQLRQFANGPIYDHYEWDLDTTLTTDIKKLTSKAVESWLETGN